jgi:hypothetical protein
VAVCSLGVLALAAGGLRGSADVGRPSTTPPAPGVRVVKYEVKEKHPALVGRIVLCGNEVPKRNARLRRPPLSLDDLLSGRAFQQPGRMP